MTFWVIAILALLLAGLYIFVDQEIYFYEGVHLGKTVQGWLYDRWAKKYDEGKRESQAHDAERLAAPLLAALTGMPRPAVLDLATGTGRFPLALLTEPGFDGHVIGLDISEGLLAQAAVKLAAHPGRFELRLQQEFPLPFPDASFDVVSCLEALEMMPEMKTTLTELNRVLKPGGILVTSRGTEASGRKAKVVGAVEFTLQLQRSGFEQVEIQSWWKYFDLVWARKKK